MQVHKPKYRPLSNSLFNNFTQLDVLKYFSQLDATSDNDLKTEFDIFFQTHHSKGREKN